MAQPKEGYEVVETVEAKLRRLKEEQLKGQGTTTAKKEGYEAVESLQNKVLALVVPVGWHSGTSCRCAA